MRSRRGGQRSTECLSSNVQCWLGLRERKGEAKRPEHLAGLQGPLVRGFLADQGWGRSTGVCDLRSDTRRGVQKKEWEPGRLLGSWHFGWRCTIQKGRIHPRASTHRHPIRTQRHTHPACAPCGSVWTSSCTSPSVCQLSVRESVAVTELLPNTRCSLMLIFPYFTFLNSKFLSYDKKSVSRRQCKSSVQLCMQSITTLPPFFVEAELEHSICSDFILSKS